MKILLLEDDPELCESIRFALEKNGYTVDCFGDGDTGLFHALNSNYAYDLAVIDRMLPVIDGMTVIKAMRRKGISIPVIITTGMSALSDRIEGLDGGADDYLVKPFHIPELLARIRALTRRPQEIKTETDPSYSDLVFRKADRTLLCGSSSLPLTAKEAELLCVLLSKPEALFTREQLLYKIWGTDADVEAGNVDNYISFLRKRLRELKSNCEIKTIYGAGYKLECRDVK